MQKPEKTIEQLARETKKYSLDAFMFVQECVGVAADEVHGRLDANQATVARWMGKHDVGPEQLGLLTEQGQLPRHIVQALHKIGGPDKMNRHVTGKQLCWAIRETALKRWGLMARGVLARWGVRRTDDIGEIIFALVDNEWLQKQPGDNIEDFHQVFSFDNAFEEDYRIQVG
jgi:uncharacterized repeat protein (TIGR04138 family)